jgi:hypothetical protein
MVVAVVGALGVAMALVASRRPLAHVEADRGPDAEWAEYRREFRRSRRNGRPLTLLRIHADDPGAVEPHRMATGIGRHLRLVDRAWADDGSVFVMLPESAGDAAGTLLARIRESDPALVPGTPRVATFPVDGLTTTALIAALYDAAVEPVPLPVGARAPGQSGGGRDDAGMPEAAGGRR